MKKRSLSIVLTIVMMMGLIAVPTSGLAANESLPYYQWSENFDTRISTGSYVKDEWNTGYVTIASGAFTGETLLTTSSTTVNGYKIPGGVYQEEAFTTVASASNPYGRASKYWIFPAGNAQQKITNPARTFTATQDGSVLIYAIDADSRVAIDTYVGVTPKTNTKLNITKNGTQIWSFEDTTASLSLPLWNYHRFIEPVKTDVVQGDILMFVMDDSYLDDNFDTAWANWKKMPTYWDPVVAYLPSDRADGTRPLIYENVALGQKFTENYGVAVTRDNIKITGSENAKVSTFNIDENNNVTFSFDGLIGGYTYIVQVTDPNNVNKALDTFVIKTNDNFYQASAYYDTEIRYTAGSTTNGKSVWNGQPSFPFFSRYDNSDASTAGGGNNYNQSTLVSAMFNDTTVFYSEGETFYNSWRYNADIQGGVEKYWMYAPQQTTTDYLVSRVWRVPKNGYISITCRDDMGNQNIKGRLKNATNETFATKLSVRDAGVGGFYANKGTKLWEDEIKPGETLAFKTITMPVSTNQRLFFTLDASGAETTDELKQALVYWDPVITYIPGIDCGDVTFTLGENTLTSFSDVAGAQSDVTVTVPVTPYDMNGETAIGAVAVYDGEGKLVNCAFGTQTTLGTEAVNLEIILPKMDEAVSSGYIKVFLFNNLTSITPLSAIGSEPILTSEP